MQVQLQRPAPAMGAAVGDIVDLPEWQANRWIARGTAVAVDGDAVPVESTPEPEIEPEDIVPEDEDGINLSEISEDEDEEDEDED